MTTTAAPGISRTGSTIQDIEDLLFEALVEDDRHGIARVRAYRERGDLRAEITACHYPGEVRAEVRSCRLTAPSTGALARMLDDETRAELEGLILLHRAVGGIG